MDGASGIVEHGVRDASHPDATWHSPPAEIIGGVVAYLVLVVVMIILVRGRERVDLVWVKTAYNLFMSVFSLWMFAAAAMRLVHNCNTHGWKLEYLWRDDEYVLREGMESVYYWFYISKYMEYLDTVFLILAQKHSTSVGWYLQVWHHTTTGTVAWVAWFMPIPSCFVGLVTNTFVHTFMYMYYALVLHFKNLRNYGHYVTMLQLTQFYLCVGMGMALTPYIVYINSRADSFGLIWVNFIYASYLVFFIAYNRERTRNRIKAKQAAASKSTPTAAKTDKKSD